MVRTRKLQYAIYHEADANMTQGPYARDAGGSQVLCSLDAIADGEAVAVDARVDDAIESVIVVRRGDSVRAWLNVCPHAGRRLDWAPGRFLLKDGILVCAAHGSSFRIDDGRCVGGPGRGGCLRAVPVTVNAAGEVTLMQDAPCPRPPAQAAISAAPGTATLPPPP